jgi:surface antigen
MSDNFPRKPNGEPIGDDVIMAYADGVLPRERHREVRDALIEHAELRQKFESFIFTRGPLTRPFDDALAAPLPERLLRAIGQPAAPPRRFGSWRLGSVSLSRLSASLFAPIFSPAMAIPALLVAVAVGWLGNHLAVSEVQLENQGFLASASLQNALESTPRGSSAGVVEGHAITPKFTFATVHGTWCRQYRSTYSGQLQAGGMACRGPEGVWRVIAQTEAEPLSAPQPGPDKTVVAGNADETLDELRGQIKVGDVLGREEELRLMKEGWRTSK